MLQSLKYLCLGLIVIVHLAACKTQTLFQQIPEESHSADSLFFQVTSGNQYIIRKDDKLNISIWNNDDISVGSIYGIYNSDAGYGKWLLVDANGEVSIPKLGSVKVLGLTLIQLKELLTKRLSETIKQPIIDVKVLNKEVTILGEVKTPGKLKLEKENYTLTDILGMAGDFDLYGDKSKIQVVRMINDTPQSISVDLTKMKGYKQNNIQILPGDVVYVTPRRAKQWDKRAGSVIIPAASAITAILLILKTFFPNF
jgi:polysaccharide biosynthesis/export protein